MRFYRRRDFVKVVHITGPTHNLLGLQLAARPCPVEVETLEASGAVRLAAADIQREVAAGVRDANTALGTFFEIRRIQFVPSDSGPASFYRELARALVQRYASELGAELLSESA